MANSHLQENLPLPSQLNPDILKRVKDFTDFKDISDTIKYFRLSLPLPIDPIGPIKYDVADRLLQSYFEMLPVLARHIDAIEDHLEKGFAEGKSFIRPEERPAVGNEILHQFTESVKLLNGRLEKIEKQLAKKTP